MLLLLWLYLAALALLVGAEINCVIAHAAPRGKVPGQKVSLPMECAEWPWRPVRSVAARKYMRTCIAGISW